MAAEADRALTIVERVSDRNGVVRWVVVGLFVDYKGAEPRCIDYRVRVVPEMPSKRGQSWAARQVEAELVKDMTGRDEDRPSVFALAEVSAPAEGIPRRVFEEASQARLLSGARAKAKADPGTVGRDIERMLDRRPRRGRPPARTLGEKLRILADVEEAFRPGSGITLAVVADRHHMERTSLRNLISWARSGDSGVPLFTNYGPGKRGGELTPAARALMEKGVE